MKELTCSPWIIRNKVAKLGRCISIVKKIVSGKHVQRKFLENFFEEPLLYFVTTLLWWLLWWGRGGDVMWVKLLKYWSSWVPRGDNALKSKSGKVGKYEEGALGGAWWVWQNASHLPAAWLRNTWFSFLKSSPSSSACPNLLFFLYTHTHAQKEEVKWDKVDLGKLKQSSHKGVIFKVNGTLRCCGRGDC